MEPSATPRQSSASHASRCPKCRSSFVKLALEIPTKRFFICGSCAHRWNDAKTGDDRIATVPSPV